MQLYNSLTKKVEHFQPHHDNTVTLYSCGPTVYDHIHIGNLSAFIAADTLRRTLQTLGYQTKHVMNFTDVDDKTIRRSRERYPDADPNRSLQQLTREYEDIFLADMQAIGNDIGDLTFVRATDNIDAMQALIRQLYTAGFAYIADDGVYFSIAKYRDSGKKYGQLVEVTTANTSAERIDNDEYDKASVHDFALWKARKNNEPAWEFELDGHHLLGRPGWHIECSAMSVQNLGQPFDIHTGGVDLLFPHHENEIAQSTAITAEPLYARFFVHNEHLLVDGRKMSKSLNNFYTLDDIRERGFEPLAFRLMILQAHYRSQTNFTWENLQAAQNRLQDLRAMAVLRWQAQDRIAETTTYILNDVPAELIKILSNDLDTPNALAYLSEISTQLGVVLIDKNVDNRYNSLKSFEAMLRTLDDLFGLDLSKQPDITDSQKSLIHQREQARERKDWQQADELRQQLEAQGILVRDTPHGPVWSRTT